MVKYVWKDEKRQNWYREWKPLKPDLHLTISNKDSEKYRIKASLWHKLNGSDEMHLDWDLADAMWEVRDTPEAIRKYIAANSDKPNLIRCALRHRVYCDNHWRKWHGARLIDYAIITLNYDVLKVLIEIAKYPVNDDHYTYFLMDHYHGHFLYYLINPIHGNLEKRINIVQLLLNNGANPNLGPKPCFVPPYDHDHRTLFLSLENPIHRFTELLLLKGVDPNVRNPDNELFIDCAIKRDWPVVVRLAVKNGVHLDQIIESGDYKGKTIQEYLEIRGDKFDSKQSMKSSKLIIKKLPDLLSTTHTIANQQNVADANARQRHQTLTQQVNDTKEIVTATQTTATLVLDHLHQDKSVKVRIASQSIIDEVRHRL